MSQLSKIRKLTPDDGVEDFSCGQPDLVDWLKRFALVNQRSGATVTGNWHHVLDRPHGSDRLDDALGTVTRGPRRVVQRR